MSERNARGDGLVRGERLGAIPGPALQAAAARSAGARVRAASAADVEWLKEEFGVEFGLPENRVDTGLIALSMLPVA
ncbi:MAG: hypothetical protein AcusKO_10490 [Acuticoccus sp.]